MKVLIIRPAALGDTLMLMPAIAHLRHLTEIILVGRYPGIYFISPYVHLYLDFEGPGWHGLFLEKMDDTHALSIPKVDRVVAFVNDPDGNFGRNLKTHLSIDSVHLFPAFPPEGTKTHAAFYLAQSLQMAGLGIDARKSIEEACKRPLFRREAPSNRQNRMVFHPGSGGKKKNYPPDFWLELIKAFKRSLFNKGENFTLLLGPAEERLHPFFRKNVGHNEAEIIFSPEKERLIPLLNQATLFIGHDSGITHLAAMLGTPTIALFKNSPLHQWRPLGPVVRVIEKEESAQNLILRIINECKSLAPLPPQDCGRMLQ